MFSSIAPAAEDRLMALMQAFRTSDNPDKVDLVLGVYMDDAGRVPIMDCVKTAEQRLFETEDTKTYVGMLGDPQFNDFIPPLLLGAQHACLREGRVASCQTPGGSGALKVAADFIRAHSTHSPRATIWFSTPTWANHGPVASGAGLTIREYPYFRPSDRKLDFDAMCATLEAETTPGDAILLHACCHNPTGVDLSLDQWVALTDLILRKGLFPLVDCAYQGLGTGLEEDVQGLRHMAGSVPEMLIASSFSKNFGIYRERCGALTAVGRSSADLGRAMQAMSLVIRSNYSMPPSHGARIVSTIFADPALHQLWQDELAAIRQRILDTRQSFRTKLEERQVPYDLSFITDQRGMFSFTGFTPEIAAALRERFGIYMVDDGRINVAGINSRNADYLADGVASVLASVAASVAADR